MLSASRFRVGMEVAAPAGAVVASFNAAVFGALRGAKKAWVCLPLLYAVVLRGHRIDPMLVAQTA
eukprot:7248839-Alexandrium_andersonii.AAC.1